MLHLLYSKNNRKMHTKKFKTALYFCSKSGTIVPLEIAEMSTTFTGKPGDVVDFFVRLNRADVQVQYQWQRLYCGESYDGEGEAIHDYAEGEDTRYIFTLDGMTEAEVLEMNPDATWPGIEMYYDQLEKANGDASKVHIEMNTPNYILDSEAAAAMNAGRPLPDADTGSWKDIEGATASTYTHTVTAEDADSFYRCRITIVDATYIAAAAAHEQAQNTDAGTPAPMALLMQSATSNNSEAAQDASESSNTPDASASSDTTDTDETDASAGDVQSSFLTDNMFVTLPEAQENSTQPQLYAAANATVSPSLTIDHQWIQRVGADMEYITADT